MSYCKRPGRPDKSYNASCQEERKSSYAYYRSVLRQRPSRHTLARRSDAKGVTHLHNVVKAFAAISFLPFRAPVHAQTVAYYRFNEGPNGANVTTLTDSGPNHLNGSVVTNGRPVTYSSAVAPYPAAQNGFALDVSGDFNFGRVPDNAALAVQGDLTVETFFRLTTGYVFSGEGSGDTLVDKQSNSTGSGLILAAWWLGIQPIGGGQIRLNGAIGFNGVSDGIKLTQATGAITEGVWHHAALVLDRDVSGTTDSLRLFLDGAQVAQTTGDYPNLFYGSAPLLFGAGNSGNDPNGVGIFRHNFDGELDEVRITAAALSPSQFLIGSAAAPEPGALALLALALPLAGVAMRRRK